MIRLKSFEDVHSFDHEIWMIVRSPDKPLEFAKHVPELSPSPELFRLYREVVHKNEFNRTWFHSVYVPKFLKDLSNNTNAQQILKQLCEKGKKKDLTLCCYCKDETLCHRSIIGGLLLGMGAKIETDPAYIKYYHQFLELGKK